MDKLKVENNDMRLVQSGELYRHTENKEMVQVELKKKFKYAGLKRKVHNYYINPGEMHVINQISNGEMGDTLSFCTLDEADEIVTDAIMTLLEKNSSGRKTKNAITIHVSKFKEMLLSMYGDHLSLEDMASVQKSQFFDIKYIMPYGNSRPRYRRMFSQDQIRKIMDLSDFVLFTHNQPGRYTLKEHKRELMYFITGNTLFMVSFAWFSGLQQYTSGQIGQPHMLEGMFYLHVSQKSTIKLDSSLYEISLGLDPEILFYPMKDGKPDYKDIISADDVLPQMDLPGKEIGLDACQELGELRPKFSFSPLETTKYAKETLVKLQKNLARIEVRGIKGKDMFIETGGGCLRSIGGHIHIGNKLLSSISVDGNSGATKKKIAPLLVMLDYFLYYPIKNNIHGGLRNWGMLRDSIGGFHPSNKNVIKELKKITSSAKSGYAFGNYDTESAIRSKSYGIEYRSLPSFITSEELTYLILKITQGITKHFLRMAFEPSEPLSTKFKKKPLADEYTAYLDRDEAISFNDFLYGKRNDIFLHHLFDNWNIKQPKPPIVDVKFRGSGGGLGADIKKEIVKTIETNKEIQKSIGEKLNIWIRFVDGNLVGDKHLMMVSPGRTTHTVLLRDTDAIKSTFRKRGENKIHLILVIPSETSELFKRSIDFWKEASEDIVSFLLDPSFSMPLKYEEVAKEIRALKVMLTKACLIIDRRAQSEYLPNHVSTDWNTLINSIHEIKTHGKVSEDHGVLRKLADKYIPKTKKTGVRV